jgi:hypothetical protein
MSDARMKGMRSKTPARVKAAVTDAVRIAYIPVDTVAGSSTSLYVWTQDRGPAALEPSGTWTAVKR